MRKTLTALLLAAALPTLAIAGPGMGDGYGAYHKRGDGYHGHMLRGLDLTPEQRQQVGQAMRENLRTQHEITQRYLDKLPAADKAAMAKEQEESRAKQQQAIRTTLTPEQQKKFDELQAERDKRRAEHAEFEAWKAERDKKAE